MGMSYISDYAAVGLSEFGPEDKGRLWQPRPHDWISSYSRLVSGVVLLEFVCSSGSYIHQLFRELGLDLETTVSESSFAYDRANRGISSLLTRPTEAETNQPPYHRPAQVLPEAPGLLLRPIRHGQSQVEHSPVEAPDKHTCASCQSIFPTNAALEQHGKTQAHKAYQCVCGTHFVRAALRKRHIAEKSSPPFVCQACGKVCGRKGRMVDHYGDAHKGEKVELVRGAMEKPFRMDVGPDQPQLDELQAATSRPVVRSDTLTLTARAVPATPGDSPWAPSQNSSPITTISGADSFDHSPGMFDDDFEADQLVEALPG